MNLLSVEYVKQRLDYNPETGSLIWKTNRIKSRIGKDTGARTQGYIQIRLVGRLYRAHRLAWVIMTGAWPDAEIDHVNLIRDDNRWINLRPATKSQNAMNTGIRSNNSSGYKGVGWDGARRKWRADIKLPNIRKHLGMFDDPALAHQAYARAAKKYFGEYGRTS